MVELPTGRMRHFSISTRIGTPPGATPDLDKHHRDRLQPVRAKAEQVVLTKLRDPHIGAPQLGLHHVRVERAQASREVSLGLRWVGLGKVETQIYGIVGSSCDGRDLMAVEGGEPKCCCWILARAYVSTRVRRGWRRRTRRRQPLRPLRPAGADSHAGFRVRGDPVAGPPERKRARIRGLPSTAGWGRQRCLRVPRASNRERRRLARPGRGSWCRRA